MKTIKTIDAIGCVLCHDITQIIPEVSKGPVFKKGHVVREEDIELLLSVGKESLYVWENQQGMLHENEAAEILKEVCINHGMSASEPSEGKIEIRATESGLLKINNKLLKEINRAGQAMIATRHGNTPVAIGDKLAGMRVIPLIIALEEMQKIKDICGDEKVLQILPYTKKKAAIITTGNEIYSGRIEDKFTPVVRQKLGKYHCETTIHQVLGDEVEKITDAILKDIDAVDIVLCTGGMSVDPDDRTPLAIKKAGVDIISYGAPMLPGAMFLMGYLKGKPVVGLPGCVMYAKQTIFDVVLPRLLAGDNIVAEELAALGEGGLCLDCEVCVYPLCGFGKGK